MSARDIVETQKRELDILLGEPYIERAVRFDGIPGTLITVIMGPRRAGKSFFALHHLKSQGEFGYINFDDERLVHIKDYDDLLSAINAVYPGCRTLLFDEIQNIIEWELFVNRLQRQGYHLYITGSNSHLLSKELATHLTGRHIERTILPFSFSEFLSVRGARYTESEKKELLTTYAEKGGFPEPIMKGIDNRNYLSALFDAIIYKDIIKRFRIRYVPEMSDLASYLVSNVCSEYSYHSLSRVSSCRSIHTVKKYLNYLEETFLFFSIPRFSWKVREQMAFNKKIYCIDNGFISSKGINFSENRGKLKENLVAIALKANELTGNTKIYFWKNAAQEEVDFVIMKGHHIDQLIQVCTDISSPKTYEREVRALLKAGAELHCNNLLMLTDSLEKTEETSWFSFKNTIHYIPLWKWLSSTT
jgi:uncharacterized protein